MAFTERYRDDLKEDIVKNLEAIYELYDGEIERLRQSNSNLLLRLELERVKIKKLKGTSNDGKSQGL